MDKLESSQRNTLIIAPASLVYNWSSEIQRFAPELTAKMVTGTAKQREDRSWQKQILRIFF
ncbi:SNF2-related protein [Blautia wexlerae]|nr:SNF2-related protein [Blautia wexlerae]